ncbi:hypothetical protein BLD25_02810 [Candidatus Gracilibacteria bacterium GN02-872]|nr:hypothetical protein BLD25_02810 [Candidatus Gracilibacteria bacterium GN02-872]
MCTHSGTTKKDVKENTSQYSLTPFFVVQEGVNTEKLPAKGKVMVAGNLQKEDKILRDNR